MNRLFQVACDPRLLLALAKYAGATYAMSLVNCIADDRAREFFGPRDQPLPDIGFDVVPFHPHLIWILDILTLTQVALLAGCVWRYSSDALRTAVRFITLHALILAMRCFTVASTSMPSPSHCPHLHDDEGMSLLLAPFWHLSRSNALMSWCNDMMFSGHVAFMVLAAWFVWETKAPTLFGSAAGIQASAVMLVLLSTRGHYTSDIAVGVIIASLVYKLDAARQGSWESKRSIVCVGDEGVVLPV